MRKFDFRNKLDDDYLKARCRFNNSLDKYIAITQEGELVDIKMSSEWREIGEGEGKVAYKRITLPKGYKISSDMVIGLVSKEYKDEPAAFEFDRVVHVIEGKILDPVTKKVYSPIESPIKVPAGTLFNSHGLEDAVLIIQLFPNED